MRTPEEIHAVTDSIKQNAGIGSWATERPTTDTYTNFSLDNSLHKLDDTAKGIIEAGIYAPHLHEDYEKSREFLLQTFAMYAGQRVLGRTVGRAFIVPMRSQRLESTPGVEAYASESTPFMPLLDPVKYGVDSNMRMRAFYGLPPLVLDTYTKSDEHYERGAVVLAPVYKDMETDLTGQEQLATGLEIFTKTMEFVRGRLGVEYIGLGATIPKITDFGNAIRGLGGKGEITTTTGHAGTVHMILETARQLAAEKSINADGNFGIIGGAGSIGWSTLVSTLEGFDDSKVLSYDWKYNQDEFLLNKMVDAYNADADVTINPDRVASAKDALTVLAQTNVIISAITRPIDLEEIDPNNELNLSGKVIIDDSQPGAFNREQVEQRGGKLVWVVGADNSTSQFVTRDGLRTDGVPYNFGQESGLYGASADFPCGQELAVIAQRRADADAIRGEVTPANVRVIGRYMREAGIIPAPYQSFGSSVKVA